MWYTVFQICSCFILCFPLYKAAVVEATIDDDSTTQNQTIAESAGDALAGEQSKQQRRRSNELDGRNVAVVSAAPTPLPSCHFCDGAWDPPSLSLQAQDAAITEHQPEELNERAVSVIGRVQVKYEQMRVACGWIATWPCLH
jgi:hypothetical protein